MPHYFTASNASDISFKTNDISNLLPEPEKVPGRGPETENDLTKWKIEELGQQIFMIGVKYPVEKQSIGGQPYEPYPEEAVEEMLPYIEELGKRCKGYLDNPEYGAEKRPVLNAYLRSVQLNADMCQKGIDFARILNEHSQAGHVATLQLMDNVVPKVEGLSTEERKNTLDAYENKVKEAPFFDLIHKGLDHMEIAGEYEIARQDEKHPMTVSERTAFEERDKNKLTEIHEGIGKVYQCLEDPDFKLEDYPYMDTKTVQNLKETRGLPSAKSHALRERALLLGGEHIEDYQKVYELDHLMTSIGNDAERLYNILPDAKLQTNEKMIEWMTLLDQVKEQSKDLDTQPDKLGRIKENLAKEGVTLDGYRLGMQEKLLEGAAELKADPALSDTERKFFEDVEKKLTDAKKETTVPRAEIEKAKEIIGESAKKETAEILADKKEDLELDRELLENGYVMPEHVQLSETTELLTNTDTVFMMGPITKMGAVLGKKNNWDYVKDMAKLDMSEQGENGIYQYYAGGAGYGRQYCEAVVDDVSGEVIHPAQEVRTLLQDMNRDVRDAKKATPTANKLQRAMQNYAECLSREALEQKEPVVERGKDGMMFTANGLWASLTMPGTRKNLSWPETEKLDAKFGIGTIMQDCVSMHEIFRSSMQRETAGRVDAAKEQKERELYGKLLDRVEKTAMKICNTPEEERQQSAGLFDSSEKKGIGLDLFGERGVKVQAMSARGYREGLNKGWPIHELPVYSAMKNYLSKCEDELQLIDPELAAGMKASLDTLQEKMKKDISGLDEKEKADFFKGLSDGAYDLNRQREELMKNPAVSEEAKKELSRYAVKNLASDGREVCKEALPDILTQAAQNSMKRAVTLGQARPQELGRLQTKAQKNALEDATLMMNRTAEAYTYVAKAQFKYRQMYKELQSLKKKGEKNSEYFQNMENALKTLAGMDGTKTPAQLNEAYKAMEDVAQTYVDKRSGFFSAWSSNGKNRKNLASRLVEEAKQDRKALRTMVRQNDELPEVKGETMHQAAVRNARNGIRGRLYEHESLQSQLLRYSNAVEQYTPPKMTMENTMEKQKDAGALNAMKQKQADKEKATQKAQEAQKKESKTEAKTETKKNAEKEVRSESKNAPAKQQNGKSAK